MKGGAGGRRLWSTFLCPVHHLKIVGELIRQFLVRYDVKRYCLTPSLLSKFTHCLREIKSDTSISFLGKYVLKVQSRYLAGSELIVLPLHSVES